MKQQKPVAKENVTTEYLYKTKTKVHKLHRQYMNQGKKIRGKWKAHKANLLNCICQIHVNFNFCTYVQELSLEETELQT